MRSLHEVLTDLKTTLLEAPNEPTVGEFLQARVHEAVTVAADRMAQMGVMTTDERITLSSAVGDMLESFRTAMAAKVGKVADSSLPAAVIEKLMEQ